MFGILVPFLLLILFGGVVLCFDKNTRFLLLFRFLIETYVVFLVAALFIQYWVVQFIDISSGDGEIIVVFVTILVGCMVGYVRYKDYLKREPKQPTTSPANSSITSLMWPVLKLSFWIYVCLNISLMIGLFDVRGASNIQWLLIALAISSASIKKYISFKSTIKIAKQDLVILATVFVLGVGYYYVRDSLPATANYGRWKNYYSDSQVSDKKITRRLNYIYRTGSSDADVDEFWRTYGVKGLPYVVKASEDLKSHDNYKTEFAKHMLQRVNDKAFIPELKKIMFYGSLGDTARKVLFRINATFTKEELLAISNLPEYFTLKLVAPEFERETEKLSPDDLLDFYLPHTLTHDNWEKESDNLRYKGAQEEILGYAKKVSEIPSYKGLKVLTGQYCALLLRRETEFNESQSPGMAELSSAGKERVLEAIKYCDELTPAYKTIIYGMMKTLGIGLIPERARDVGPSKGRHFSTVKFKLLSLNNTLSVTVRVLGAPVRDLQGNLWEKKNVRLIDTDDGIYVKNISFDFDCPYGYPTADVEVGDKVGNTATFAFSVGSPTSLE